MIPAYLLNWDLSGEEKMNTKEAIMQIQQGDVLIRKAHIDLTDAKNIKRKNGAIILAEGEATGHAHRIFDVNALFFEKDGKFYLKNDKSVIVQHEEHEPITIEPGIWEVGQVREKNWLSGMISKVVD